ncbi:GNAT family N-acetyltransferase [Phenylobacterium terrae]|uniref:GNAT family N-acetyltransferase n=1 Tax=Phenylobacterium terrae TaxID=2665495 RepID=A0ABW4N3A3_9CAUL
MAEAFWSPGSPPPERIVDIPTLASERLLVRRLCADDLEACHRLWLDIGYADAALDETANRSRRAEWLAWSQANYDQLSGMMQPPYGDRAVVSRKDGRFLGVVGLVPAYGPFDQLQHTGLEEPTRFSPEVGLFWAVSPPERGLNVASEAAELLIAYAFEALNLKRIVATTERDNAASLGVMRRLGMTVYENPYPEPAWFQMVGVLEA